MQLFEQPAARPRLSGRKIGLESGPDRGYPSPMTLTAVILALLVLPARADEISDLFKRAKESPGIAVPEGKVQEPPSCTDGITAKAGKFCENVADCMKFCSCACVFDPTKWKSGSRDDGSTTCGASMPDTGVGMLPADSPQLLPAA